MSLRARTILAAATATLVAVIVLGLAVDILVARDLRRGLDHSLRTRAAETAQLASSAPALLTTPGALDSPVGATQAMVEVVDKQGRIVARSLSLGGRVLPRDLASAAIADGRGGLQDRHLRRPHAAGLRRAARHVRRSRRRRCRDRGGSNGGRGRDDLDVARAHVGGRADGGSRWRDRRRAADAWRVATTRQALARRGRDRTNG